MPYLAAGPTTTGMCAIGMSSSWQKPMVLCDDRELQVVGAFGRGLGNRDADRLLSPGAGKAQVPPGRPAGRRRSSRRVGGGGHEAPGQAQRMPDARQRGRGCAPSLRMRTTAFSSRASVSGHGRRDAGSAWPVPRPGGWAAASVGRWRPGQGSSDTQAVRASSACGTSFPGCPWRRRHGVDPALRPNGRARAGCSPAAHCPNSRSGSASCGPARRACRRARPRRARSRVR